MGVVLSRGPCPVCSTTGKGKSMTVFQNGTYCFECGHSEQLGESLALTSKAEHKQFLGLIPEGEYTAVVSRGISANIAAKHRLSYVNFNGTPALCWAYYHEGKPTAQKLKLPKVDGKAKYVWLGDRSKMPPLWGMDMYEPNAKLSVTICEGETDWGCRASLNSQDWPILSLIDGAGPQAIKAIAKAKEYLLGFKSVILLFDGDEVGRKTAEDAAAILGPKARIVNMPDGEDVCSLVAKGGGPMLQQLELSAASRRPKDIVRISDYSYEQLYTVERKGVELPFPKLNNLLRGLKSGALYMFCAGSGLGKSTVIKEIAYDLMFNKKKKVGIIFLEQDDKEAMKDFIAMHYNIEAEDFNQAPEVLTTEKRKAAENIIDDNAVFYSHFGSLDVDALVSKVEYMFEAEDCEYVFLDHISMVVSGSSGDEGERRELDKLMTKLRTVIQKHNKSVLAVSHLKRPQGDASYNEGAPVSISSLRGSAGIEQISDYIIGLERDQFGDSPNQITLKVLKCRRGGTIGYCDKLVYSRSTGRLTTHSEET